MPRIELIDVPLFGPNDPYHFEIDNLPLRALIDRQELINLALDKVLGQMRDAIGTQGSFANRLNQSIDEDGNLKLAAIDEALHSVEKHTDTDNFVRMLRSEAEKLALVADEATDVSLEIVREGDDDVPLTSGKIKFESTDSVSVTIQPPNRVRFDLAFPPQAAHRHFYGLIPVPMNITDPDLITFKVNASSTIFIEGSLRVYINGTRINEQEEIFVPGPLVEDPFTLIKVTPHHYAGFFELSAALSEDDVIIVDFDVSFL